MNEVRSPWPPLECTLSLASCRLRAESLARRLHCRLWTGSGFQASFQAAAAAAAAQDTGNRVKPNSVNGYGGYGLVNGHWCGAHRGWEVRTNDAYDSLDGSDDDEIEEEEIVVRPPVPVLKPPVNETHPILRSNGDYRTDGMGSVLLHKKLVRIVDDLEQSDTDYDETSDASSDITRFEEETCQGRLYRGLSFETGLDKIGLSNDDEPVGHDLLDEDSDEEEEYLPAVETALNGHQVNGGLRCGFSGDVGTSVNCLDRNSSIANLKRQVIPEVEEEEEEEDEEEEEEEEEGAENTIISQTSQFPNSKTHELGLVPKCDDHIRKRSVLDAESESSEDSTDEGVECDDENNYVNTEKIISKEGSVGNENHDPLDVSDEEDESDELDMVEEVFTKNSAHGIAGVSEGEREPKVGQGSELTVGSSSEEEEEPSDGDDSDGENTLLENDEDIAGKDNKPVFGTVEGDDIKDENQFDKTRDHKQFQSSPSSTEPILTERKEESECVSAVVFGGRIFHDWESEDSEYKIQSDKRDHSSNLKSNGEESGLLGGEAITEVNGNGNDTKIDNESGEDSDISSDEDTCISTTNEQSTQISNDSIIGTTSAPETLDVKTFTKTPKLTRSPAIFGSRISQDIEDDDSEIITKAQSAEKLKNLAPCVEPNGINEEFEKESNGEDEEEDEGEEESETSEEETDVDDAGKNKFAAGVSKDTKQPAVFGTKISQDIEHEMHEKYKEVQDQDAENYTCKDSAKEEQRSNVLFGAKIYQDPEYDDKEIYVNSTRGKQKSNVGEKEVQEEKEEKEEEKEEWEEDEEEEEEEEEEKAEDWPDKDENEQRTLQSSQTQGGRIGKDDRNEDEKGDNAEGGKEQRVELDEKGRTLEVSEVPAVFGDKTNEEDSEGGNEDEEEEEGEEVQDYMKEDVIELQKVPVLFGERISKEDSEEEEDEQTKGREGDVKDRKLNERENETDEQQVDNDETIKDDEANQEVRPILFGKRISQDYEDDDDDENDLFQRNMKIKRVLRGLDKFSMSDDEEEPNTEFGLCDEHDDDDYEGLDSKRNVNDVHDEKDLEKDQDDFDFRTPAVFGKRFSVDYEDDTLEKDEEIDDSVLSRPVTFGSPIHPDWDDDDDFLIETPLDMQPTSELDDDDEQCRSMFCTVKFKKREDDESGIDEDAVYETLDDLLAEYTVEEEEDDRLGDGSSREHPIFDDDSDNILEKICGVEFTNDDVSQDESSTPTPEVIVSNRFKFHVTPVSEQDHLDSIQGDSGEWFQDTQDLCKGNRLSSLRYSEDDDDDDRYRRVLWRSTSLKTGKTPPGTPRRKKIVRFADALGLDLEAVRHIVSDDIPVVPASAFMDLKLEPPAPSPSISAPVLFSSRKCLCPQFSQPSADRNFIERVKSQKVCLENVVVSVMDFYGVVRVLNCSFHKCVTVRYTVDEWKSHCDVQASYVEGSSDGFSDRFKFSLQMPGLRAGDRVVFALKFTTGGEEYWDNNDGRDYALRCMTVSRLDEESDPRDEGLFSFV